MGTYVKVAAVSEIPEGGGKSVQVQGKPIALFNLGGTFYAMDDTCSHAGGPLSEGLVDGEQVECPWHGARFDVKTGAVLTPPAGENQASYKVRVNGSDIEVEV